MDEQIWHRGYDPDVPREVEVEAVTVPEFLAHSASAFGGRPALIFQNRVMTYRELDDEVNRLATALAELGVDRDTRVAIQLPNLPQTVVAFYATLRLGAQAVMTNPLYVERELEHQWRDAGCTVAVVADFLYASRIAPIREKLPIQHFIVTSIPDYLRLPIRWAATYRLRRATPPMAVPRPQGRNIHALRTLIRRTAPALPNVRPGMDDVAVIQYTGGTTGRAKGAMLTHRNLSANVQQIMPWFTNVEMGKEVFLACSPFFHVYGLTIALNLPVRLGAAIVMVPNPRDIAGMIKMMTARRVTVLPAVPALFNAIANYPRIKSQNLTSIKACFSAAAPLPVDLLERFEALTRATIIEGFGMTETSPVTHANPLTQGRKPGSIGVPIPNTEARVVDVNDGVTELPIGEAGELVVRGPQVMKGYWQQPEATAETIRDGWLHTGDIATMDADGFFFIVGRKKDLIIVSGYNVYPDEIDAVLASHSDVLEAATIGIPHPKRGETVKSFVVCRPGASVTNAELMRYCREQLAAYKVPREIERRESLPKSAVLKILRRQLRDEELAKTERDRASQVTG